MNTNIEQLLNTYYMTDYRLVPEWFPQRGVLMSLPHEDTDWAYMLDQVHRCCFDILRALVRHDAKPMLLVPSADYAKRVLPEDLLRTIGVVEADYNDTWIRDYGPLTLKNSAGEVRLADFGFNGWGLKFAADKDNLVCNKLFGPGTVNFPANGYRNYLGYILEGGSVEVDESGTLLTTTRCLCSPNRNGGLTKAEVEKILTTALGVNRILWLDYGELAGDDTDSHIDTLARMCPDETILYAGCDREDDEHYAELKKMKQQLQQLRTPDGNPYNLVELPLPEPIYDESDGHRLPATYANYLVTDKAVLVPAYGQPKLDELARKIIGIVYHNRIIESVDCRALIRQHGSLHCATMQLNS